MVLASAKRMSVVSNRLNDVGSKIRSRRREKEISDGAQVRGGQESAMRGIGQWRSRADRMKQSKHLLILFGGRWVSNCAKCAPGDKTDKGIYRCSIPRV